MQKNMGTVDRIIRAVIGVCLLASWPLGMFEGTLAIVFSVVGVVLLVTAALRWCPPYMLLGINTGAAREDR